MEIRVFSPSSWNGFNDELAWGAAWLAKATGEQEYLDLAESMYDEFGLDGTPTQFSWDDKTAGLQVLLLDLTGDERYASAVDAFIDYLLFEAARTPQGLVYLDAWGSNRHAGNVAHALMQVQIRCFQFLFRLRINLLFGSPPPSAIVRRNAATLQRARSTTFWATPASPT